MVHGTLDLIILQTLKWGPQHAHGIGQAIRARYYRLTPKGKKQLRDEQSKWRTLVRAVAQTMKPVRE